MSLRAGGDPGRFDGHVDAARRERDLFVDFYDERDGADVSIAGLRRHRRRAINRLRTGPAAIDPAYYAVLSNFETEDPDWRFWRNFRQDRLGRLAASVVFPGANDLVIDTSSMTSFGVPGLKASGTCDFRTSSTVWHCNYFRQKRTIDYIAARFGAY